MKLSGPEKLILHMLADLHEHLNVDSDIDAKFIKSVIGNNSWALDSEYGSAFSDEENSPEVVSEVTDILVMWTMLKDSFEELTEADKARVVSKAGRIGAEFTFPGFDGNNESEHMSVYRCQIEQLRRFSTLGDHAINSHHATLDMYRRMFAEFDSTRGAISGGLLSADQLIKILNA